VINFAFRCGIVEQAHKRFFEQGNYLPQGKDAGVECCTYGDSGAVEPAKLGGQVRDPKRLARALI